MFGKGLQNRIEALETANNEAQRLRRLDIAAQRDKFVEIGRELQTASERIATITRQMSKLSLDMMELDRRITALESAKATTIRNLALSAPQEPAAKPVAKMDKRKTREDASTRRRWFAEQVAYDEVLRKVWNEANAKGVSMDVAALYERTGGYECHKGRLDSSAFKGSAGKNNCQVQMLDYIGGKREKGGHYVRTINCQTEEQRDRIISYELPVYHGIWKAHYGNKGGKQ